jgi:hypothetical protein
LLLASRGAAAAPVPGDLMTTIVLHSELKYTSIIRPSVTVPWVSHVCLVFKSPPEVRLSSWGFLFVCSPHFLPENAGIVPQTSLRPLLFRAFNYLFTNQAIKSTY